jgi:amidase
VLHDYAPDRDATIVERLLDAGADIVAVLNMDSFGYSGAGDTSAYGPTLNPHDTRHLAGGSSSGSAAALFYDGIDATIGGDQGGSIRIPASWCGVLGLKPTHGLVPYTGIVGLDQTYDHVGPLARTVENLALVLGVIVGKDPGDPRQREVPVEDYQAALGRGIRGLRIGLFKEGFEQADMEPDVAAAARGAVEALRAHGAEVTEVSVPEHGAGGPIAWGLFAEAVAALWLCNGTGYHWQGAYDPAMSIAFGTALRDHGDALSPQGKLEIMVGAYLREAYHGRYYAKAQNLRAWLRAAYDRALQAVDVLAMPTSPVKAHRYEADLGMEERILRGWSMLGNTAPFNMTGHPSISIPCGKSMGLPIGLMLTGRHFQDATLLTLAAACERHLDWEHATAS